MGYVVRLEERVHGLLVFVVLMPRTHLRHIECGISNRHAEGRIGVFVTSMVRVLSDGTVVTHIARLFRDDYVHFLRKFRLLGRLVVGIVDIRSGEVLLGDYVDRWEDEIGRVFCCRRWDLRGSRCSRRLLLKGPLRSLSVLHRLVGISSWFFYLRPIGINQIHRVKQPHSQQHPRGH
jgi:hypothetical protein